MIFLIFPKSSVLKIFSFSFILFSKYITLKSICLSIFLLFLMLRDSVFTLSDFLKEYLESVHLESLFNVCASLTNIFVET